MRQRAASRRLLRAFAVAAVLACVAAAVNDATPLASAHQSGCHRWHSCPSDSGSYVCGDEGYSCQYPTYSTGSSDSGSDPVDPGLGSIDTGPDPLDSFYADQQSDLDRRAGRLAKRAAVANSAVLSLDTRIGNDRLRESRASARIAAAQPSLRRAKGRAQRLDRRADGAEAKHRVPTTDGLIPIGQTAQRERLRYLPCGSIDSRAPTCGRAARASGGSPAGSSRWRIWCSPSR